MKKISLFITAAALTITAAGAAAAAELPSYEKAGLPISAVQLQVLGAENVRQTSPVATSVAPVQLRVRNKVTTAQGRTETVGRGIQ